MSRILAVKSSLGLTNISVSTLSKEQRKAILNQTNCYNKVDKLAKKLGVDVSIKQTRKDGKLTAHLRSTSYEHIQDVPYRTIFSYQGDSLMIPITKNATPPAHAKTDDILAATYQQLRTLANAKRA